MRLLRHVRVLVARELVRAGVGELNPGGDADDAKVVNDPIVETATNAAH